MRKLRALKIFRILHTILILLVIPIVQLYAAESSTQQSSETVTLKNLQPGTITGLITDEFGDPLPGVNVFIKGTTQGSITNVEGNYTIEVPDPSTSILVVSFIGYLTQEVEIGNNTSLDFSLKPDYIGIEEVVVTGFTAQKKVNLTGSVATVKGEDMIKRPVTNAATMLQGQMSGVQVIQYSGEPGNEGVDIKIRGLGTFSGAGSNPLILIDGMEGRLEDVNPQDIENVSVLKDAASAAIYGSRAANGVIIVTTKQGTPGQFEMEYEYNYGVHSPTKMFDFITNSVEYMELSNEAWANSLQTDQTWVFTDEIIDDYRNATDREQYPNFSATDYYINPAPVQRHHLSFKGGSERTLYNFTLGYIDQKGIMAGYDYKKYNVRLNIVSQATSKIRFGVNLAFKRGIKNEPSGGTWNSMVRLYTVQPMWKPFLPDGSGRYATPVAPFSTNNNYAMFVHDSRAQNDDYVVPAQGWVEIELIPGLKWYTKGAFNFGTNQYQTYGPTIPMYDFHTWEFHTYGNLDLQGATQRNDQTIHKSLFSQLNYEKTFGNHNVNALAGYSVEDNTQNYLSGSRQKYALDAVTELNAGSPAVQYASGTTTDWALMSFYGRLGYNYGGRYLIEGNLRYDGSSRLTPESRWDLFPSISAGWRISEESFMGGIGWLDNLKIRGSWGTLGNQNIGTYPYQALLKFTGPYSFDDANLLTGVAQTDLNNPNIGWETTTIADVGFDITVFSGLSLVFDLYNKTTENILRGSQVTYMLGLVPPTVNRGTMENKGWDASLQYRNSIKSGVLSNLRYNLGFNIDHYKNKLVEFGEEEISWDVLYREGLEYGVPYTLVNTGIFQNQAEIDAHPPIYGSTITPGEIKLQDNNGLDAEGNLTGEPDGVVDAADRVPQDGTYPNLAYSFNAGAQWKGFDLYVYLQGVEGQKYMVTGWGASPFTQGAPPRTIWRDRWTETNKSTTVPKISYHGLNTTMQYGSTYYYQDASYMRIKNITVGYTLPSRLTQRVGVKGLRIYFSGDNLFTFTDYPDLDPEGGYTTMRFPQNKVISFGASIKL